MFGRDWEPATATIVMARVKGQRASGLGQIYEFVADVQPTNGAPAYRATLHDPDERGFRPPGEGMSVKVLVDGKHKKAKFDMSDPARVRAGDMPHRHKQDWAQAAGAEPGTPVASAGATVATLPTDAEMMAAWQAKENHSRTWDDVRSRNDMSQAEAWTATSRDLSTELMRLHELRPDWKSPSQLAMEDSA